MAEHIALSVRHTGVSKLKKCLFATTVFVWTCVLHLNVRNKFRMAPCVTKCRDVCWPTNITRKDYQTNILELPRTLNVKSLVFRCNYFLFNTLRPRQNGRLFADDTSKRIFLKENVRISIQISLKFVPKSPIDNISALFQIMAWRRPGASHYLKQWW